MSLQLAAQHLAAQGRGPDKQLVHMSPREVAGLQALAKAHGGSLSVNPKTGLPEAGFLDNLLPTIIGAGLMYATGGASAAAMPGLFGMGMPATIGLGLGAFETARTGNLQKGLMAGLGAYGGAGMFGALAGAGAAGAAGTGAAQAAGVLPQAAAAPGFDVAGLAASPVDVSQFASPGVTAAEAAGRQGVIDKFAQEGFKLGPTGEIAPLDAVDRLSAGDKALRSIVPETVTQQPQIDAVSRLSPGDMALRSTPYQAPTVAERFAAMPTKDKFKYGLAALSPALLAQPEYKQPELDREQYRYAYSPGRVENPELGYTGARTGERTYFRPSYTRLAAGGPVENMSAANVYDMQHARGGVTDMGVDMSTGMERMAEGGISGLSGYKGYSSPEQSRYQYTYDPKTQSYREVVPVIFPADVALPFVETGGYGGGEMGGGPAGGGPAGGFAGTGGNIGDASTGGSTVGTDAIGPGGTTGDAAGVVGGGFDAGDGIGFAKGGISDLGDYSDGGRLLKGPGDGVSDSIPAMIGRKQPARLADGEFVVPARIVSELGNGSTDAGARKLYAMMDRIQKARGQTVGKGKVAKNSRAEKYLPA